MFAVVHCPEFYLQCERLFRPDFNGQALVIASNDGAGGSRVIASSTEAQGLGIMPGLHGAQLSDAFAELAADHVIEICSPNYEFYADLSARLMKSLSLLAPKVSACASDEALLDLEGIKTENGLNAYAKNLRYTLKQWLGISVLVGIAPTKTLAKLACNAARTFEEYQGVIDFSNAKQRQDLLKQIPVTDISGISKKVASKLSEINIHTALELSKAPKHQVRRRSSVFIERVAIELSGLHCNQLEGNTNPKKTGSIIINRTEAHTFVEAKRVLSTQVISATDQLNTLMSNCEKVTVRLTTTPLNQQAPPFQNALTAGLPKATNSVAAITKLATQLLEGLWREGKPYHSLTLNLEGLSPSFSDQFGLFSSASVIGENSSEYDLPKTINFETLLGPENTGVWYDKRSLLSPSFTTKWSDIPRVS